MSTASLIDKLRQIRQLTDDCLHELNGAKVSQKASAARSTSVKDPPVGDIGILAVVNKIRECDEADNIEKQVLDKRSAENRILLPLFICHKYFPHRRLSTGDISRITSELGVKIEQPNVAKTITNSLLKYLDSDSTRKKGKASLYKLNRRGVNHFESLLNT